MRNITAPRVRIAAGVLVGAVSLAALAPVGASATSLISEDTSGDAAGGAGLNRALGSTEDWSPDGRFVLFTSTADDLVEGISDTNGGKDVFLRDLQAGTTAILSVDAEGNALGSVGNDFLSAFVFSPDSKHLLFRTQAASIVAGLPDTNNAPDWFVRDLLAGTTSCVTVNAAGSAAGNSNSFTLEPPVFSPDGKLIAFISQSGDLVGGVTDLGGRDLFVRDLEAGTTSLVSVATDGGVSGLATDDPAKFSPDGRYLAWLDMSPELVAGVSDTNNFTDLFVRDLETSTTFLVTRGFDDAAALFGGRYEWAPDGHAIAFTSGGTNLVEGLTDTNIRNDLFLWTVESQEVEALSVNPDATSTGDDGADLFGFSPDSRYVAFASASTNLTPESAGGDVQDDLYVRDLQTDATTYVARNASASVVWSLAVFSPDGEHLLFATAADDVVPGLTDTNGRSDLFLFELATGETSGVTVNFEGTATANTAGTSHDDPVLSPDGRYISFVSDAGDLVPDFVTTSTRDLFVRDLVEGETTLVTEYINGGGAGYDQGATRDAEFTPDNRYLVFTDNALLKSPVTTPFNFTFGHHVYAFDVANRSQSLLTMNAASDGPASGGSAEPFSFIVNPAGGTVLFLSTATDMVAGVGDEPSTYDVFVAPLPEATGPSQCGDPVPDASQTGIASDRPRLVKASDSLFILRVAVGSETCEVCVCDVDGSGSVSATDALVTLKIAVGQPIALSCPAC